MEVSRIEETELSKELCDRLLTHFREQVGKVFKIRIRKSLSSRGCLTGHDVFFSQRLNQTKKHIFLQQSVEFVMPIGSFFEKKCSKCNRKSVVGVWGVQLDSVPLGNPSLMEFQGKTVSFREITFGSSTKRRSHRSGPSTMASLGKASRPMCHLIPTW